MEFKCPGRGGNNQILDFDKSKMHVSSNLEVSRGKKKKRHPRKAKKGVKYT